MKRNTAEKEDVVYKKPYFYDLETKIRVFHDFENGMNVAEISRKYMLYESTVRKFLRDKDRILKDFTSVTNVDDVEKSWLLTETESILKLWCSDQIRDNIELTKESVCEQAIELFESLKLQNSEYSEETFNATDNWYYNFKRQCDWDQAANRVETASASNTNLLSAPLEPGLNVEKIRQAIEKGGYSPQTVFNISDFSLFWKKLPDDCKIARAEKASSTGFKESKDPITIMVGGNAAGDFKLKPLMVYRTENPKALHGKSKGGLPVIWKFNPKACMLPSLFEHWFGNYFIPSVQSYCTSNGIPFKVMLIIASTPAHLTSTLIDFDHRVKIFFIPHDETYSQPMYTELISILKADYTRRLLVHVRSTMEPNTSERYFLLAVLMAWQKYNILHAIRIIADTWESLNQEDWNTAWEKLFPSLTSNGVDESVGSTTVKQSRFLQTVEDIVKLSNELKLNVNRRDILALLDSHSTELTPEEFLEIRAQNILEEQETLELSQSSMSNMTVEKLTEALTGINNGLNMLQDEDSNESRARDVKKKIYKLLQPYEETLRMKIMKN